MVVAACSAAIAYGSGYWRGYAACEHKWLTAFGYFGERWTKMYKNALEQRERQEMKDESETKSE